jgi:hypothetical protein
MMPASDAAPAGVIGGLLARLGDGLGVGEGLVDDADGDFDSGSDGASAPITPRIL